MSGWWRKFLGPGPHQPVVQPGAQAPRTDAHVKAPTSPLQQAHRPIDPTGPARVMSSHLHVKAGAQAPPQVRPAPPSSRPQWSRAFSPRDLGRQLGSGGEGSVYEFRGHPDLVAKIYHDPVDHDGTGFGPLVADGAQIHTLLTQQGIDLAWPRHALIDGGRLVGCIVPRIPANYAVCINGRLYQSALQHALPRAGAFVPDPLPSDVQRLEIARKIAILTDVLHAHDYTYGDFSWMNFLFQVRPAVRVMAIDLDSSRRVGHPTLTGRPQAHSADWEDRHAVSAIPAFDTDRYKLALLVYRLVVSRTLAAPLEPVPDGWTVPGLGDDQAWQMARLFRRAGHPGGRPTAREWRAALGDETCGAMNA